MKIKILKNMLFILCMCLCFIFITSFYNFVLGFPIASTIKTERYNTRRAQYHDMLEGKPEKFKLKTEDDIDISGMIIEQPKSNIVLLICHGYKQSKDHLAVLANLFSEYTVVLFDLRAHGDSSGSLVSFGYHEYKDVCAVVNFIKQDPRLKDKKLYGLGISMGGASLANAASKGCRFDGIILDSCFSIIDFDVVNKFVRIPKIFFNITKYLFKLVYGIDIDSIRPGIFLSPLDCPIQIMHSKSDEKVSISHAYELYDNLSCKNKSIIECEGSHGHLFRHDSTFYKNKITDFLSQILV